MLGTPPSRGGGKEQSVIVLSYSWTTMAAFVLALAYEFEEAFYENEGCMWVMD